MRLPVSVICCNWSSPGEAGQGSLSLFELEGLLHEMGHALHNLLTEVDEAYVAGLKGVSFDLVELPSTYLQRWVEDERFLRLISDRSDDGEALFRKMKASVFVERRQHQARGLRQQLHTSSCDLELHARDWSEESQGPWAFVRHRAVELLNPPTPEEELKLCLMPHSFAIGYAAKYYIYLWGEIVATQFHELHSNRALGPGLLSAGRAFRDKVLAMGGSVSGVRLLAGALQEEVSVLPYLRSKGLGPSRGEGTSCPLLDWTQFPNFQAIKPEQLPPVVERLEAEVEALLEEVEAEPLKSFADYQRRVEPVEDRLWQVLPVLIHQLYACTTSWSELGCPAVERLQAAADRISASRALYLSMGHLLRTASDLSLAERRVLEKRLQLARQLGASLDGPERVRFEAIQGRLRRLEGAFSRNLSKAAGERGILIQDGRRLGGLSTAWRARAAEAAQAKGHAEATAQGGPWYIPQHPKLAMEFMDAAEDRDLRRQVREMRGRWGAEEGSDNRPLVEEALHLKHEMALLLGQPSYAQSVFGHRWAPSVEAALGLIDEMGQVVHSALDEDVKTLEALAREAGAPEAAGLRPWDVAYWQSRARQELAAHAQHVDFELALEGLFKTIEALFGVRLSQMADPPSTWHPDVRVYRLHEGDEGSTVGFIYLDAFARPGEKRAVTSHHGFVPRRMRTSLGTEGPRLPASSIHCHFSTRQ